MWSNIRSNVLNLYDSLEHSMEAAPNDAGAKIKDKHGVFSGPKLLFVS